MQIEFADQHRTAVIEAPDDGGVGWGHAIAEEIGAEGGADAGGIEYIFECEGDAVQRPAIAAGTQVGVGGGGLGAGRGRWSQ